MLLAGYGILLAAGLALNSRDRYMLTLTLLVGASIFTPVPRHSAEAFYAFCIAAELVVALAALTLHTQGSICIAELCLMLVVAHALGYTLDGFPPLSPYRVIVKLLETSQLICCIVASPPVVERLRNDVPIV